MVEIRGWCICSLTTQGPSPSSVHSMATSTTSIHPFISLWKRSPTTIALDVVVERKGTTRLTCAFGMKTHTDQYLSFVSHHHPWVRRSIFRCFKSRAEKCVICRSALQILPISAMCSLPMHEYPDRLVRSMLPGQPTTPNHQQKHDSDGRTCPKAVVPAIHCWSYREDWTCLPTPWDLSDL